MSSLTLSYLILEHQIHGCYALLEALAKEGALELTAQITGFINLQDWFEQRGLFDFCTIVIVFRRLFWPKQLMTFTYFYCFQPSSHYLSFWITGYLDWQSH